MYNYKQMYKYKQNKGSYSVYEFARIDSGDAIWLRHSCMALRILLPIQENLKRKKVQQMYR